MAKKKPQRRNTKKNDELAKAQKENELDENTKASVDKIWKHMGMNHIDISYACVGFTLDGRPVLNYDEFVNLLVNYGFYVQDIVAFIDDFASQADDRGPIIMMSSNSSRIISDITPLK